MVAPSTVNTLDLPGSGTNYASTPDSAAVSITSDWDIRVKVSMDDWSAAGVFVAKWGASAADQSYRFYMSPNVAGRLHCSVCDGSNVRSAVSTVGPGFTNGTAHWVRATWTNSDDNFRYYTCPLEDGSTWVQLGTAATGGNISAIWDNSTAVRLGATGAGGDPLAGNLYYAEIRNGIGGTVVASFDATAVTKLGTRNPTTVPVGGTAGGNWTINGSAWDWAQAAP